MPFWSALFWEWISQVAISPWLAHLKGLACRAGAASSAAAAATDKRLYLSFMEPSGIKVLLCSKGCSIANGKSLNPGHYEGPLRADFVGKQHARMVPRICTKANKRKKPRRQCEGRHCPTSTDRSVGRMYPELHTGSPHNQPPSTNQQTKKSRPKAAFIALIPVTGQKPVSILEAVTDTEVVAVGVVASSSHGTVQGLSSAVLVAHVSVRCVQSRALGQVVHVAQSDLVRTWVSTSGVDLVGGVSQTDFASAHGRQTTDQEALAFVAALDVVLVVVSHDLGHAQVVLTAQVHSLDVARQELGVRESQSHVDGAIGVTSAQSQAVAVLLVGCVAQVFTHVVLGLAVETAQVARQEVADGVRSAHGGWATQAGVQGLGRANTVRAERIEHGQVPELGRVITAQTHFTEAAVQADGRTTVEGQAATAGDAACALVVGAGGATGTVVVFHASFEPERSGHAATQIFNTAEAQTAAVVAGVRQLGLVGDAAGTVCVGSVNDTEQGYGRLSHCSAGSSQHSQGNQGFFHCELLQG